MFFKQCLFALFQAWVSTKEMYLHVENVGIQNIHIEVCKKWGLLCLLNIQPINWSSRTAYKLHRPNQTKIPTTCKTWQITILPPSDKRLHTYRAAELTTTLSTTLAMGATVELHLTAICFLRPAHQTTDTGINATHVLSWMRASFLPLDVV